MLQDGKLDSKAISKLELKHLPSVERSFLVGDYTAWGRVQARHAHGLLIRPVANADQRVKPIGIGHRYSRLGVVPEGGGSWFLPLLHEFIASQTTALVKLAW